MYVNLQGEWFSQKLLDEIEALTDKGKLRPEDITYDRNAHLVRVPLIRYPIKKAGWIRSYAYDTTKPIACVVVIRNIVECTITDNTNRDMREITLLFGISFKEKEVCISSAEEDHGTPCFLMTMKVDEIQIELRDSETIDGIQDA